MFDDGYYRLSLRVNHPNLHASVIEEGIGLPAKISRTFGEQRTTPKGDPLPGKNKITYVSFNLDGNERIPMKELGVEEAIKTHLSQLDFNFTQEIHERGGRVEFFLGVFFEGNVAFELDTETVDMMSSAKIGIIYDLYGGSN